MKYEIEKNDLYYIVTPKEEKIDSVLAPSLKADLITYEVEGAKNIILIELLKDRMKDKNISLSDHHGIEADYLEAVAFAFLAKKTLNHEPGNIKSVTGANDDVILGGIYLA